MWRRISILSILCTFVMLPINAGAIIANPNSSVYYNDNHAQLFFHGNAAVSVEVADVFGALPGWSSSFGFFFGADPTTRVAIFGSDDQGAPLSQKALIDFANGRVVDIDAANIQSTFTNSASPIGFYLDLVNVAGGELILYTLNSLNPGGFDLAATFQAKTDSSLYLIGFEVPNVGTVAFDLVGGITAVPEPSTLLLLGGGVVLAIGLRFRSRSNG